MARLTDLPVELCVKTLRHLPPLEIVLFQQVSRNFLALIRDSVELQYLIERFLVGVADVSPNPQYSSRERLDRLRAWSDAWTKSRWSEQRNVPSRGTEHHVSGPVIAFALGDFPRYHSLEFYLTGSQSRGIAPRSWGTEDLGEFSEFVIDWYQDLLVLLSSDKQDSRIVRLRLLTCTTTMPHPAAADPVLTIELPENHQHELKYLYICGDLLGFRSSETTVRSIELSVYDWKQGNLLMHIGVDERAEESDDPVPDSYAFLDSRHVLVTTWGGDDRMQVLAVFDCRASAATRRIIFPEALQDSAMLVLEMPQLSTWASGEQSVMYTILCASNSPDALRAQTTDAAFRPTAPPVVAIIIGAVRLAAERCLLVSGRYILGQISRIHAQGAASSVVRIPWQAYAHECRLVKLGLHKSVAQGARFATMADIPEDSRNEASSEPFIHIWHFDEPAAVRRQAVRLEIERGSTSASSEDTPPLPALDCVLEVKDYSDSLVLSGSDADDGSNTGDSSDGSTAESSRSDDLVRQTWAEPMPLGAPVIVTRTHLRFNGAKEFYLVEDGLVVLGRNNMAMITL